MSAMTPLGAGAKLIIYGNEDAGFYVVLKDEQTPIHSSEFATNTDTHRGSLANFVWLVKSAAAFHKIGFDPGPLEDLA